MTLQRYRELLAAGQTITREDRARLATLRPRLTIIAASVRSAVQWWWHWSR